jgi:hypothetical protein
LGSFQIFNAILLRFPRLLRNSPRSWVRHTRRPALPGTLEKPHPKAKSSMSPRPHLIFTRLKANKSVVKVIFLHFVKGMVVFCLIFAGFFLETSAAQTSYSLDEAIKVLELIEKVNSESEKDYSGPLRRVVVAESELNSYLAFRLEQEEDILKELRLKLFNANRIEGKILLRFEKTGLSLILEPEMIFYFSGTIKVKEETVRLAIDELFLNKEPVDPLLLDTVIYLASKLQGTEYTGLSDWYELPYGIKDVRIEKGRAIFYY